LPSGSVKILLVDDERLITSLLERYLQGLHHDVTATTSPEAAAELLEKKRFDVLISDVAMEPINGIELVRRLRSLDTCCRVILVSGTGHWEDIEKRAENLGVDAFVEKPFDLLFMRIRLEEMAYENDPL
jgi:CheY-like chemotaxis protein